MLTNPNSTFIYLFIYDSIDKSNKKWTVAHVMAEEDVFGIWILESIIKYLYVFL